MKPTCDLCGQQGNKLEMVEFETWTAPGPRRITYRHHRCTLLKIQVEQ